MSISTRRDQIDTINREIVCLLGKRLELAREIARLKKEHQLPILDVERETVILEEIKCLAKEHQLSVSLVEEIFKLVLDYTKMEMGAI
jgi:chorismate mutase